LITRLKRLEAENDPDVKAASTKLREQIERTERSMYAVMSTELRGRDDAACLVDSRERAQRHAGGVACRQPTPTHHRAQAKPVI
jgi:hypothetical protein